MFILVIIYHKFFIYIFLKIVYSIVEMSIAGINYFMDDWRLIYGIFIAGPAVIAFISSFKLKETPSFYSTKKNIKMVFLLF